MSWPMVLKYLSNSPLFRECLSICPMVGQHINNQGSRKMGTVGTFSQPIWDFGSYFWLPSWNTFRNKCPPAKISYTNDTWIVTPPWQLCNALMPKQAGLVRTCFYWMTTHWCMVVYTSVPQQQNIFFSWMKRPSDDCSRRIIPVPFWEVLHTLKYFFSELEI